MDVHGHFFGRNLIWKIKLVRLQVPFWTFMGDFLEPLGYGRPRIRLPFWLVFSVAAFYELVVIPLVSLIYYLIYLIF